MNKKILIIEDDPSILKAYTDHLKREGYEVDVAHDGEEGLNKVEEFGPDLILLDIIMPKMDGITMLKKLRKLDSAYSNVPVIFLTNLSDEKTVIDAIEAGSMSYLVKADHTLEDVVERVRLFLK